MEIEAQQCAKQLRAEADLLNNEDFPLAQRLIFQEIERLHTGKTWKDDRKMVDVTKEKSIRLTSRVYVPAKEHPKFNFVGKLLGPKGNSLKRLQEDTMTKMAILGKGSMRDRQKEQQLRSGGDPKFSHLIDELHVEVTSFAPPAEAYARMALALTELRRFLVPDYNDDIRLEQMREMQMMSENGGSVTDKSSCEGFDGPSPPLTTANGGATSPSFSQPQIASQQPASIVASSLVPPVASLTMTATHPALHGLPPPHCWQSTLHQKTTELVNQMQQNSTSAAPGVHEAVIVPSIDSMAPTLASVGIDEVSARCLLAPSQQKLFEQVYGAKAVSASPAVGLAHVNSPGVPGYGVTGFDLLEYSRLASLSAVQYSDLYAPSLLQNCQASYLHAQQQQQQQQQHTETDRPAAEVSVKSCSKSRSRRHPYSRAANKT